MPTFAEQETSIAWSPGEEVVRVYSAYPPHVRRMRADAAFSEVRGGKDYGEFEIPRDLFDPMRGRRRPRVVSDEQRAASSARMREMRARQMNPRANSLDSSIEPAPVDL